MGKLGFCLSVGILLMIIGGYPLLMSSVSAEMALRGKVHDDWDLLVRMFDFSTDVAPYSVMGSVIFIGGAGIILFGIISTLVDGIRWIRKRC